MNLIGLFNKIATKEISENTEFEINGWKCYGINSIKTILYEDGIDISDILDKDVKFIEENKTPELPEKINEIENINIAEEQISKKEIVSKLNKIIDYLENEKKGK